MIQNISYNLNPANNKSKIAFGRQTPNAIRARASFKPTIIEEKDIMDSITRAVRDGSINMSLYEEQGIEASIIHNFKSEIIPMLENSKLTCKQFAELLKQAVK